MITTLCEGSGLDIYENKYKNSSFQYRQHMSLVGYLRSEIE